MKACFFLFPMILAALISCGGGPKSLSPAAGAGPDPASPGLLVPDPQFQAALLQQVDANHDGRIDVGEAESLTVLDVSAKGIRDLAGLQQFRNVRELYCSDNELTSLDLTGLARLEKLGCSRNRLNRLVVAGCPVLTELFCSANQLTELGLSGNPALTLLNCKENQLQALDLTRQTALKALYADANDNLRALRIGSTSLEVVSLRFLPLQALPPTSNAGLKELYVSGTPLGALDLGPWPRLQVLEAANCSLGSLNLAHSRALKALDCANNPLEGLDLSALSVLEVLDCAGAGLLGLDLASNPALREIRCGRNAFQTLDLRANPLLRKGDFRGSPERPSKLTTVLVWPDFVRTSDFLADPNTVFVGGRNLDLSRFLAVSEPLFQGEVARTWLSWIEDGLGDYGEVITLTGERQARDYVMTGDAAAQGPRSLRLASPAFFDAESPEARKARFGVGQKVLGTQEREGFEIRVNTSQGSASTRFGCQEGSSLEVLQCVQLPRLRMELPDDPMNLHLWLRVNVKLYGEDGTPRGQIREGLWLVSISNLAENPAPAAP